MTEPSIDRHQLRIETDDGLELEAELAAPATADTDPRTVVVACHPHPLHGGSMHANVVDALFRSLPPSGTAVLRFNFRGTGSSGGTHDEGRAERLDVRAAVAAASQRWPGASLLLAGYSFGADVALTVTEPSVGGWLAVAPPLRVVDRSDMGALADERPTTIVAGTADQFNPFADVVASVGELRTVSVIPAPGADHFFAVGIDVVVDTARSALVQLAART